MYRTTEKIMRGSTPTLTFAIPFDGSTISDLRISGAQDDKEILCKCKDDCTVEDDIISVTLTQEDTLKLDCKQNLVIQVKVMTAGNDVLVSDPIYVAVGKCFCDEVLTP